MKDCDDYVGFFESIKKMTGKKCRNVFLSGDRDYYMSVNFDEDWESKKSLSPKNIDFDAEFSLLIDEASWRIEDSNAVLCTFTDDSQMSGFVHEILNGIVGKRVIDIKLFAPSFDLFLLFEDGVWLKIFCTWANEIDVSDNYIFLARNFSYTIGNRSTLLKKVIS